jgi:phage baseplate assembly protein W
MPIGLTLPIVLNTGSLGVLSYTITQIEASKMNLKSLVLTNWGERVNHYDMGCNLVEFLFENNTGDLEDKIRDRIQQQVGDYLPYINLKKIDIQRTDNDVNYDGRAIKIQITFALKGQQDVQAILDLTI